MSATLTQHLATTLAEKSRVAETRYRELVERAVNDEGSVDPDEALLFVERAGKAAHDFDADVRRIRQIKALEATVARLPDVIKRRNELDAAHNIEFMKDKAALADLETKIKVDAETHRRAAFALDSEERGIISAKQQLRDLLSPDPQSEPHPADLNIMSGFSVWANQ